MRVQCIEHKVELLRWCSQPDKAFPCVLVMALLLIGAV